MGIIKIPEPDLPENELNNYNDLMERFDLKLKEYEQHFDDDFTTENLGMSIEEIIENIEKCIKYNRKWDGFIVPIIDDEELI